MKFDPFTGEPIEESSADGQQVGETTVLYPEQDYDQQANYNQQDYDQQQAYYNQQDYDQQQAYYNQQVYAQPAPSRKKWVIPAIIGTATVTVAAIAVVVIVMTNLFLSPANRIMAAADNTFSEGGVWGEMAVAMEAAASSRESTVNMYADMVGVEFEFEYRHTQKDKQAWMSLEITSMPEIEGTATITENELQVYAPLAGDHLFFYDYTKENTGALIAELGEENVKLINEMLTVLYTGEADVEENEELAKALKEWSDEIEYVELEKEKFEINDKEVACSGYSVTIDEAMLCELIDIIGDAAVAELEESDMEGGDEAVTSMEESIQEMKDELSGMSDVTFSFYLDSNMFAAIIVEVDGEEEVLEILFQGGEYRAQNIVVAYDDEEILEIKGETEDDVETVVFVVEEVEVFSYEYDTKSGDFELTIDTDDYGTITVEANINCDRDGLVIEDGEVKISGMYIDFAFSYTKGATIEKMSGERFDIGNATQEEIMNIMGDIQTEIY